MKTTAPRNCIIGIVFNHAREVGLFHVDNHGDIACAINRNTSGKILTDVTYGATMFSSHIHNHWSYEVEDKSRAIVVDSHCIDPRKLNTGDLRRLAKKCARLAK